MARYKRGATPKLSHELIEKLSIAIRNGSYVKTASALGGISKDTFYRWLQAAEGRYSNPLLMEFSNVMKKVMTEAELRDLGMIQEVTHSDQARIENDA